ncbi:helix-turn-helix domain-containing protein [Ilumatobacter sp.]|uniref:helix-turn-helix domain-containing protein n=1 Tax=Ilumatobacter sp. TaxID=1967498 RepID=UPI003AF76F92
MSVFGEYFRSRREELGLSQREAAKRLGVSANTVARWERGTALPTAARADSLRDLLGISRARIADLVRGTPPPSGAEVLEARIAELEDRIAELEEKCAQPVTSLEDQYENRITLGPSGISIESPGKVKVDGTGVDLVTSLLKVDSGMVSVSGVVQADTVITNSVVSTSYTPGAGNVW